MITLTQLKSIMPCAGQHANAYFPFLNEAMDEFQINTPARVSAFIAQIAHESAQLSCVEENFNYSPEGILATFNTRYVTRFTREQAYALGRTGDRQADKVSIANIAYANRMGNGDIASGDGWKYRGSGLIQLTGKGSQLECCMKLDVDIDSIGDWLRSPEGACRSAAWFWSTRMCNQLADKEDFDGVSDIINIGKQTAKIGDSNGYADRFRFFQKAKSVIA